VVKEKRRIVSKKERRRRDFTIVGGERKVRRAEREGGGKLDYCNKGKGNSEGYRESWFTKKVILSRDEKIRQRESRLKRGAVIGGSKKFGGGKKRISLWGVSKKKKKNKKTPQK